MTIRRAEQNDIPRIAQLLLQVHKVHSDGRPDIFIPGMRKYTDEELAELIGDDQKPIYVYSDEDGILQGYAFCVVQITEPGGSLQPRKAMYIDDLCVDERARRKGIGEALYRYVVSAAKSMGFDAVTLNVWTLNGGAEAFYRRMGMEPLKTVMEQRL